jgi:SAM-dependent methyltransferase
MRKEEIKKKVVSAYGRIAKGEGTCSCGSGCNTDATRFAKSVGYSDEELRNIPKEANLALSCGNPTAHASLRKGETVLDLGSGAGFDCFLAAAKVGARGKVIGLDMTPEMIDKARKNAKKWKASNVEFRLGEIENLPIEDESIDVIISNCVLNLSPDKAKAFKEAYRVLKQGGRIAISDIALTDELPERVRRNIEAYVGCIGGALLIDDYKKVVEEAGFRGVKITVKSASSCIDSDTKDPLGRALLESLGDKGSLIGRVVSVYVEGHKKLYDETTR